MEKLTICTAIATAGRASILSATLEYISSCVDHCDDLAVCPASEMDINTIRLSDRGVNYRVVNGSRGSSAQRNALIESCNADLIAFFDDDYLPATDFITEAVRLFSENPSIVVATGQVLADGIMTAGLNFSEARGILDAAGPNIGGAYLEVYGAYGCNMVVRMATVRQNKIRFDEALPLYSWQEDIDFSRQLAKFGEVVKCPRLRGVHMGTKRAGRSPGKQLGYSQIANPIYLSRKGSLSWGYSWRLIARNVAANIVKSAFPEPWADRRGRLRGNLLAARDFVTGRLNPGRILTL